MVISYNTHNYMFSSIHGDKRISSNLCSSTYICLIPGICTTKDVDFFFAHMNNARFIRILDFARIHFYDRTGLYQKLIKANGQLLVGASTIRYRRSLDLFNLYRIETKVSFFLFSRYVETMIITNVNSHSANNPYV